MNGQEEASSPTHFPIFPHFPVFPLKILLRRLQAAYMKILESSQTLLHVLKRETAPRKEMPIPAFPCKVAQGIRDHHKSSGIIGACPMCSLSGSCWDAFSPFAYTGPLGHFKPLAEVNLTKKKQGSDWATSRMGHVLPLGLMKPHRQMLSKVGQLLWWQMQVLSDDVSCIILEFYNY